MSKKNNKKIRAPTRVQDKTKAACNFSDDLVEMPAAFARELIKQVVYNPKKPAAQKTYSYTIYTKENILKWLQNPSVNEKNLRDASNYMYLSSMHYQRLINYYAGLYLGAYVISPVGFDAKAVNKELFIRQFQKIAKALDQISIPHLLREIINVSIREGAYYGVRWSDKCSCFIQKINPDYCKITSVSNGTFLYSVNMSRLQGKLEFYPPEFTDMYAEYLATGERYQEVPSNISVCVKGDPTILDFSVPLFAAVMPSLYTIANTESLQETATELKNYKMMTGKVPVDEEGVPLIGWDLFQKYYAHLKNALGENVGLAITPFALDSFSFEQRTGVSDVDDLAKVVGNFWSTAGTSGLLHGISNDTSGVTKLSIKNDETFLSGIIGQFERLINRYLKVGFTSGSKFKVTILPITVFNREEYLKSYKEAASFGLGKSYYAAALGIPQSDVAGLDFLEREAARFNALSPMQSSYNTSGDQDSGRPELSEEDLSESGEATRGSDANANR